MFAQVIVGLGEPARGPATQRRDGSSPSVNQGLGNGLN
jgi:hypothetical protein